MEAIEDICTQYIRQNVKVYGQDVPLNVAETIRGVRKIFEEKYPNPVRVVSVGVPLEEILADVNNERWEKISVEFCGGTHVAKTGDIKDLVILSEESIAKGIRRIFAITGSDAQEACRLANEFDSKLTKVENMAMGVEKLNYAAALKNENEKDLKGRIPAVRRSKFGERIKAIEQESAKLAKEKAKADEKLIVSTITEYFAGDGIKKPGLVALLHVTPDPKLLTTAIATVLRKLTPMKPVFIFAADSSKVVHVCYVPQVFQLDSEYADWQEDIAKLDPKEWSQSVVAVVGGGKGGKGSQYTGNSPNVTDVKLAVDAARKLLEQSFGN